MIILYYIIFNGDFHHGFNMSCSESNATKKCYEDKYQILLEELKGICNNIIIINGSCEMQRDDFTILGDRNNEQIVRNEILNKVALNNGLYLFDMYGFIINNRNVIKYVDYIHFDKSSFLFIAYKFLCFFESIYSDKNNISVNRKMLDERYQKIIEVYSE